METIIASTLLSLSTNVDNFAVGIAYSVKKLTISFPANLLIASLSGISTFTSMSVGDWVNHFLSPNVAHKLGSGILIIIGFLTIWDILKAQFNFSMEEKENNSEIEIHNLIEYNNSIDVGKIRKFISLREALLLGLALTITNLGTGIGAGIAQLNLLLTSCFSFLSSLLTIGGGSFLGNLVTSRFSGSRLELLSGILLISLGLYEYMVS
ncbi:MAG: manganese efflux pump [Xenococcaceae cyanobacterium]